MPALDLLALRCQFGWPSPHSSQLKTHRRNFRSPRRLQKMSPPPRNQSSRNLNQLPKRTQTPPNFKKPGQRPLTNQNCLNPLREQLHRPFRSQKWRQNPAMALRPFPSQRPHLKEQLSRSRLPQAPQPRETLSFQALFRVIRMQSPDHLFSLELTPHCSPPENSRLAKTLLPPKAIHSSAANPPTDFSATLFRPNFPQLKQHRPRHLEPTKVTSDSRRKNARDLPS